MSSLFPFAFYYLFSAHSGLFFQIRCGSLQRAGPRARVLLIDVRVISWNVRFPDLEVLAFAYLLDGLSFSYFRAGRPTVVTNAFFEVIRSLQVEISASVVLLR